MSEIIIFSDIHISKHKQSVERLQDCLDTLYWVLQTARGRGAHDVIFGGDLFQSRYNIDIYTYHQTYKIIEQFPDLHLWLLLGNHDLWYSEKSDISSVVPMGALPHVTVIDSPRAYNVAGLMIDFLPFTKNPHAVMAENFFDKSPVLVGHVAIDGATLNFHHRTKSEVSVEYESEMLKVGKEIFDGYRRVFLGHYHGAQQLNEVVEYIGSTLQLTFNEAFQVKHVIALDTDTLGKEYIENTFSPKHLILSLDELDTANFGSRDFIRVDYDSEDSHIDIADKRTKVLERCPEVNIAFIQRNAERKAGYDSAKKFDLADGDVLNRYINAVGVGELDKDRLLNMGKEICLEG